MTRHGRTSAPGRAEVRPTDSFYSPDCTNFLEVWVFQQQASCIWWKCLIRMSIAHKLSIMLASTPRSG
eukprot:scaffold161691_cov18-Tisochrysis_lutea.AAC.1